MPRYFFNIEDSITILDDTGQMLADLTEAKSTAIRTAGELLKDGPNGEGFWAGLPWQLWVTDGPNGGGKTFFTLRFWAELHV